MGEKDISWHVVSIDEEHLQSLTEFLFAITQRKKILGMKIGGL